MDAHVSKFTVLAFAIGHVQNDMAACCWFTYLLIYLENAVMFHPAAAGVVMLSGQIFDAIATPVVGLLSDSSSSFSCCGFRFCKRTKFHFFGTVLVTVCFTGVWIYSPFDGCPECEVGDIYQTIYYATAAALFNVGWASVQVSHLALITDLAADENIRTRLTSKRYSATIVSNLMIFLVYLFLIKEVPPIDEANDKGKYRYLGLFTLAVGLSCTFIFYLGMHIKTVKDEEEAERSGGMTESLLANDGMLKSVTGEYVTEEDENQGESEPIRMKMEWHDWLKQPQFYKVGFVYMATRALINIVMVYITFYLIKTLQMEDTLLAVIPCILYVSSFFATLFLGKINKKIGRRKSYLLGAVICIGGSTACFFLDETHTHYIYPIAVCLGLGTATVMVGGVSMVNDLIGNELDSSAFVYGCMSFTDKLGSGLLIIVIQLKREGVCLEDESIDHYCPIACSDFIRKTISFVPIGCALLGLVAMGSLERRGTNGKGNRGIY